MGIFGVFFSRVVFAKNPMLSVPRTSYCCTRNRVSGGCRSAGQESGEGIINKIGKISKKYPKKKINSLSRKKKDIPSVD
jgi:hypothetical protein